MDGCCHTETNESKTEFIYFGSRQQLSKCSENTTRVISKTIDRCEIDDLGRITGGIPGFFEESVTDMSEVVAALSSREG